MNQNKGVSVLENSTTVTQEETMKLVSLFRKNGFRGEYASITHSKTGGEDYAVVMVDAKTSVKGLFSANLADNRINFQHVIVD
jgi:hypothetical protein